MEKFQIARVTARRNIMIADHMLSVTYPLVNDPKLLLAVLENMFLALTNSMACILHYERLFKRIPPFHETFESKYNMFVAKIVPKYKIDRSILKLMQDSKDLLLAHKKSPIEFVKGKDFIICSDSYKIRKLTMDEIKNYVASTKTFVENMAKLTERGALYK